MTEQQETTGFGGLSGGRAALATMAGVIVVTLPITEVTVSTFGGSSMPKKRRRIQCHARTYHGRRHRPGSKDTLSPTLMRTVGGRLAAAVNPQAVCVSGHGC